MRWIKLAWRILPGLVITGLTIWAILFFVAAPQLPDTSTLWRDSASPAIILLDEDQRVIETRGGAGRRPVRLDELPDHLGQAVIAIEDRRFHDHFGLDVIGITRALVTNITRGRTVQGGSTITQQLAKNLFLTPERSLKRKFQELALAVWLETRLSKDDILALYLNRVYFGAGAYGVDAAARRYFNKSPRALTLAEAAMIAGLVKAPSVLAPTNDIERARKRTRLVLDAMVDAGFITSAQADNAKANPASVAPRLARETGYFVDLALSRAQDRLGRPAKDLVIKTTLDLDAQRAAEAAVNNVFERELVRNSPLETALVLIDDKGAIKAMLGGRFYGRSSFNRAISSNRQVGSAFKPIVYLTALQEGLTPATTIDDAPITVDGWSPRNAGNEYLGRVTLTTALARSLNAATVRLAETVGRNNVIKTAQNLGIDQKLEPHPSLALGTATISVLDMARAYTPIAFGGRLATLHLLDRVRHGNEKPIIFTPPPTRPATTTSHASQLTAMLQAAVNEGTGRVAQAAPCNAAGKTGTTQRARDAWFIGYCNGYLAAIWVGFDDNRPMRGVTGGGLPTKIWTELFSNLPERTPPAIPAPRPEDEGPELATRLANEGIDWLLNQLNTIVDDLAKQ